LQSCFFVMIMTSVQLSCLLAWQGWWPDPILRLTELVCPSLPTSSWVTSSHRIVIACLPRLRVGDHPLYMPQFFKSAVPIPQHRWCPPTHFPFPICFMSNYVPTSWSLWPCSLRHECLRPSNNGIMGSNPTQGRDICVYSVFVLCSGFVTG
jgi:hypothetical protein